MLQIPSKTKGSNSKTDANSVETAASSSKMPQIPPKCWFELKHAANNCKYHWNGSFQLQNAAKSKEYEQNRKSQQKTQNGKKKVGPVRTHIIPYLLHLRKSTIFVNTKMGVLGAFATTSLP